MTASKHKAIQDIDVKLSIDTDTLEQLELLQGQRVLHTAVWEESIIDALTSDALKPFAVDMDVYLEGGVLFELYGVMCYLSLDSEPFTEIVQVTRALSDSHNSNSVLAEIAVDTEDDLVLVLQDQEDRVLYLNTGAWSLSEWDELPD